MTVYLVLPADRLDTFGRWLRLLIQQALTVNARNIEVKPDKPVLFMIDEAENLGRLSMLETAYSLMAGFGMQIWMIIQSLNRLEEHYGKGWETFITNSGVIQYFGSRDWKTAEYFSNLCGVKTEKKFSLTKAISDVFGYVRQADNLETNKIESERSGVQSRSYSESTTEDTVQRKLAFPDELMTLRNNDQVLFIENMYPLKAKKLIWYDDDNFKNLGRNLHKKTEKPLSDLESIVQDWYRTRPNVSAFLDAIGRYGCKLTRNRKNGCYVIFRNGDPVLYVEKGRFFGLDDVVDEMTAAFKQFHEK